jgi:hypothetical protein
VMLYRRSRAVRSFVETTQLAELTKRQTRPDE